MPKQVDKINAPATNERDTDTPQDTIFALPWKPASMMKAALDYAAIGWKVFPVHEMHNGKCSCGDIACKNPAKHPRTPGGHKDATDNQAKIRKWWSRWPNANIGVMCAESGLTVVDVDPRNGGNDTLAALETQHDKIGSNIESMTGGGGRHIVFASPKSAKLPGKLGAGIDLKCNGYILAPPSNHASGRRYEWASGKTPFEVDVQLLGAESLPAWIAAGKVAESKIGASHAPPSERYEPLDFEDFRDAVLAIPNDDEADRDRDQWLGIGAAIHHYTKGKARGLALFDEWSQAHGSYDREKTRKAWASFGHYTGRPTTVATIIKFARENGWRPAHETGDRLIGDVTLARQFAREHSDMFRFVAETRTWLSWDAARWNAHLASEKAFRELQRMLGKNLNRASADLREATFAESVEEDAADAKGQKTTKASKSQSVDDARKAFDAAHAYYKDARKMRAVFSLIPHQKGVLTTVAAYDKSPWLLGVKNGVLDLQTGELRQSDAELNITKAAGCAFDPKAVCPKFDKFLERIIPDADARDFLRRAVGYTLTGSVDEEKLFFAHGVGRNGKSVFANIISALLGDYAVTVSADLLMADSRKNSEAMRAVTRLVGARLALLNETPLHAIWDDSAVKTLASREAISGRQLYREGFDFWPTHKLWIRGNHIPGARDASDGFWRRMVAVKFGVQIPAGDVVSNLDRQIIEGELSGVLNWALSGALDWRKSGLRVPASIVAEVDRYRSDSDTLGQWLDSDTELAPGERISSDEAFNRYARFCREAGLQPGNKIAFGRAMADKGVIPSRTKKARYFVGLRFKDVTEILGDVSD